MQPRQDIHKTPRKKRITKLGLSIVVLMGVFLFGLGLGNGSIAFGSGTARNQNAPANLNYSSVENVYDLLRKNYDGTLDNTKLLDGLKKGLVNAAGDPYTEYLTAQETEEFNADLNGTFSGIGAELGKENDNIVIIAPISGFPAEKAGLKPKDVVAQVNGESTHGLTVSEAVNKIRGEAGTSVKLRIVRNGNEDLTFDITRDNITIPSVDSKILDGNIGYLKISRFSDDTASLASKAAQSFKDANVKGVILDVRGNPGGLLDAAVNVSSLWLPSNKTVLQEKRGNVVVKNYTANGGATLEGVPTVVLIDDGSASASEITAGALKDNGVATLLGVKSYGKGSVQQIEHLPDGASLKVTIARWYTPNGRNIDKEGIEPDTKVEQNSSSTDDQQLNAAVAELKK